MVRTAQEKECIKEVWKYYKKHKRDTLPWRKTQDAYRILVSEIMLQQTQVDRVIPKYKSFLKRFPTLKALANASLGDVLREWQGLGYNRRAKMLHLCAKEVMEKYKGKFPLTHAELVALPGIGNYTAGAIMAFAYDAGIPIVETNIRTVIIHHCFHDDTDITDKEVLTVAERILDFKRPREWYYALMDYGSYLKKTFGNSNQRSKHYTKQSPFKNSDRQIRGAILRTLAEKTLTREELHTQMPYDISRIDAQLERLSEEEMIIKKRQKYTLP